MNRGKKLLGSGFISGFLAALVCFCIWQAAPEVLVYGAWEEGEMGNQPARQETGAENQAAQEMLEDMELQEVQQMIDQMLGEDTFSLGQAVQDLMDGKEAVSKEKVLDFVWQIVFSQMDRQKQLLVQAMVLALLAALFTNFSQVFDKGQVGEMGFYIVYLLLFTLLLNGFYSLSRQLEEKISGLLELMRGLTPAYYLAVAASSGAASAAMFYQLVLILVSLIQWIILTFVLPCTGLYVLLQMVNFLSKEEILSRLADLIRTLVEWSLKTLMGVLIGMQVVRGLVAPVIDSLKRTALGKTASVIPGVGNALNAVTEIVLASAVLVRNCLGAAFLIILLIWGVSPLIQYGTCALLYKFAAALVQPVSDKRLVGCLGVMGEGCGLLLKILYTTEILCMITIAVLAASFGGG